MLLLKNLPIKKQEEIKNLNFNKEKSKKDITGQTFNHLTVLGRGPNYKSPGGKISSQWWCICDCPEHNIILVRISNLTSGNTKSCGCHKKAVSRENIMKAGHNCAKNITGQQFGELIALYPTQERNNGSVVWQCKCSCGRLHKVSFHDLQHHRIVSCGHNYDSKGVRKIKELLNKYNIPFETEKCFSTCKFPDTNRSGRFDFYINNTFLLEYDGEQHFFEKDSNYFKDNLKKRQAHDQFKNQWCKQNNIPLKRISYLDIDKLTINDIMGDKYLI